MAMVTIVFFNDNTDCFELLTIAYGIDPHSNRLIIFSLSSKKFLLLNFAEEK